MTRVNGRATSVVRSRIELTQQQQSILQFLLSAHPTVGVSGYQIMMKKTCPALLAIARKRSRLLGVIIAHHAATNDVHWTTAGPTCAPAQSSPITPAQALGRLSVKPSF